MKKIILLATLFLTSNALADYKIFIQSAKLDLPVSDSVLEPDAPEEPSEYIPEYIPEPDPWEPPSGVPAMHPNGVTVACLNMPNGEEFELNDKTYRVVYTKEDAVTYASTACTSNVTDMRSAFENATNFNSDISHWDTSKVTNMYRMFINAENFNRDISNWDVSKVSNMYQMFYGASKFNQDLSGWDTENISDMRYMFYDADAFNYNLNDWCVSQFSSEPYLFNANANNFSQSNEPLWGICPQNANKVEGASLDGNAVTVKCDGMPSGETIKIYDSFYRVTNTVEDAIHYTKSGKKVCTSNITDMSYMFQHNLNATPPKDNDTFNEDISHWDTSNVTNMRNMFENATNFNSDISHWDTSKVTNMYRMFINAKNFNRDISNWDVSKVSNMYQMFYGASKFNQDLSGWDTENVSDMRYMFYDADAFNYNLNEWCVSQFDSEPYLFNANANNFSQSNEPLWGICPQNANKVEGASLDGNGVTVKCDGMPNGETIEVNGQLYRITNTVDEAVHYTKQGKKVCTSNITDMSYMFQHNLNATPPKDNDTFNEDISHWDTSNVTNMRNMFENATNFNSDISHWDTSKVTNMYRMFINAKNFNRDISNWDVSKVSNMYQMFYGASKFNQDLSGWDTENVSDMRYMFYDADAFNYNLNDWCVSQFSSEPYLFNANANNFSQSNEPLWGICPQNANKVEGASLDGNAVTVKCDGMPNGETIEVNGQLYRITNTVDEAVHYTKQGKKVCTSNITDMSYMFQHNLNATPPKDNDTFNEDISHWDTSNVTNMRNMFENATNFNSDISHWDTSKVTNMYRMFLNAENFNRDIGNWDVSKVSNMYQMFYTAKKFNQDLSGWDTENVSDMRYMFYDADAFNYNLNDWCVSQFSSEPYLFNANANNFSQSNEPLWGEPCN
jgi:surface protein